MTTGDVAPEIDGLSVVGKLGGGGQADVWWANDGAHGRMVALKVFRHDADPTLFDRERKATGLLSSHEHVVHMYGSGQLDDRRLYLMLEFADGGSLADHQADDAEVIDYVIQIAGAVVSAHEQGVIHRDIKPENVLLFERPDGRFRAKLSDFGIAAVPGTSTTTSVRGSTVYAPPELLSGHKTQEPGDIYSLGATLFYGLAGEMPAVGLLTSTARDHALGSPIADVWRVIESATKNDPNERYVTAAEFRDALLAAHAASRPGAQAPVAPAPAAAAPKARIAGRRPLWQVPIALDSTRNIAGLTGGVGVAGLVLTGVLASGPGVALVAMGYAAGVVASHALGHD